MLWKDSNLQKYEKKNALELTHEHLWIKKNGSKITDSWEIIHIHKRHNCARQEKVVKESAISRKFEIVFLI